jgi:hypothetical protein
MESFVTYVLRWPSMENFLDASTWAWPLCETIHFLGLSLLVGIVGMFDLRVLGMAKGLPLAPFQRLLPWGVAGFVLCLITGLVFVTGLGANLRGGSAPQYDVLTTDLWLQLKLLFIFLAGINALVFYRTGVARRIDALGPGDDAPPQAKAIAGISLSLWIGVMWFGRLIPWDLPTGFQ